MPRESDADSQENTAGEDEENLKVKRINDIRRTGLHVVHIIHRHGIQDIKNRL
ncbi:MAG: hypothetical protein Q4G22_14855 [Paracoccus sp. (in: a-proteobacteria)]|uniref:hypothetical protein n=1 Tax=Paracoccus sp. TaxID=267 RepID=UPI0026DEC57E|nr:hypothetical protein [Paracoccus sp. (in: a-proteobacteria)]MDO5633092.1 hypothetical protein [Paracoccus sp. (in: a-proteobacteria)]